MASRWHGNVEVQVPGLGIVDSESVDEDEGLLEGCAANGEVGLHAFRTARLDIERWVGAQQIDNRIRGDGGFAGKKLVDGAVRIRRKGSGSTVVVTWMLSTRVGSGAGVGSLCGGPLLLRVGGRGAEGSGLQVGGKVSQV